jgi:thiol-disulfide isomerase/thioredoxin
MKILVILLLLFYSAIFGQHTQNIIFNKTAQFEVEIDDSFSKINAIRANVNSLNGSFDICLIDFNQNGIYLDTLVKNKKPKDVTDRDILFLTEYNLNRTIFTSNGNLILTNNFSPNATFAINGHLFKISDFNKEGYVYNATLTFVDEDVNWNLSRMDFYKKWMNKIIVDNLNQVQVFNLKTNKNQNIQDFLKEGNYLYVDFIASWCGPCFEEAKNIQKAHLPENISYLAVAVESDKEDILQLFKTHEIDKWDNLFIEMGDYEKMVTIGGIEFPFGILFDEKGKVVLYGARLYELTNYFRGYKVK